MGNPSFVHLKETNPPRTRRMPEYEADNAKPRLIGKLVCELVISHKLDPDTNPNTESVIQAPKGADNKKAPLVIFRGLILTLSKGIVEVSSSPSLAQFL
jgi:hypothetical protein